MVLPSRCGSAIVMVLGGMTLALLLGIPLGSQIGELFGWRATFLFAASLSGIACFAIAMWLPTISQFSAAGDVLGAALGFIGGLLAVCHSHERAVQVVKQLES